MKSEFSCSSKAVFVFLCFLSDSGHGDIQIIQNDTKSDFFFFFTFLPFWCCNEKHDFPFLSFLGFESICHFYHFSLLFFLCLCSLHSSSSSSVNQSKVFRSWLNKC